jgi:hypothetical protein
MNLFSQLLNRSHKIRPVRPAWLRLEALEDRAVPTTLSSITANFNGTAIPAGDTLWFSSSFQAGGLPGGASATIHVDHGSISFTAGGTPYQVSVPDTVITLTSGATSASASFDPTANDWNVSAPTGGAGNVFMGGAALPVTSNLPGGIKNVTWSANFWSDTPGVNVQWHWGTAVYSTFSPAAILWNIKPVDNDHLSVYLNGDHAGTPEAYKTSLVAGGTGDGHPGNYTGQATPNAQVTPSVPPPPGMTYITGSSSDYPFASSNPLTSVAFNESSALTAAALSTNNNTFDVWYTDEHALTLGVNQVTVIAADGTSTTTTYAVSAMNGDPGAATNPAVGAPNGVDPAGRPLAPSLYITDITNDPTSRSGDWQYGGTALAPSAVFGAWKSATETINNTLNGAVTISEAIDPARNGTSLGPGADTPPPGLPNDGYTAEVRWSLTDLQNAGILLPGHNYRFYVMVHDGDQNKSGGDVGQASYSVISPIPAPPPASLSGHVYNTTEGGPPIAGVTLTLSELVNGVWTTVATTTTATDGSYSFSNLQPGTYQIVQTPPAPPSGFTSETTASQAGTVNSTTDGSASGDVIGSITLSAGNVGVNYDFIDSFNRPPA